MMCKRMSFKKLPRMIAAQTFAKTLQKLLLAIAIFSIFMQCRDEEILPVARERFIASDTLTAADTTSQAADQTLSADCRECAYIVPVDSTVVDGKVLGLKPGSVIGLNSAYKYGTLEFHNIEGTEDSPIIIRNFGGVVNIRATDKWHALKTENSKHFRITGGDTPGQYGINVQGGEMGLKLDGLSTNFEIDHVEISNVGFAGIMAKTDPTCDDATIRGNFTMYDVSLHDNYLHQTGGEGFYVGNSFYDGMERECGVRLPHEIKGLSIFNNIVKNTGWEAIQVGCAIEDTEIYNNTIENYGTANKEYQNNGIQIGSGTGGSVYNNLIKNGTGNGLIVMGIGDNVIYNNIIIASGSNGIFCDERFTPGEGFQFVNNTIIDPAKDGIRLYSELVPRNTVINNIIVNPGSYGTYDSTRSMDDSFVYINSADLKIDMSNNLFARSLDEIRFVNPRADNYRLKPNSPAVNYGKDISTLAIRFDFYQAKRKNGSAYDIGASEY